MTPIKENFRFLIGDIKLHPSNNAKLEYLVKSDAVCIAVFDNSLEYVYLVEQYRPGADKNILEIPAGLIDKGEQPICAAYRELSEETGFYKDSIESIVQMPNGLYVTPGYSTELLYFYGVKLKVDAIAKDLNLDDTEEITVHKVKVEDALKNTIDVKSKLGILYFKEVLKWNIY